MQSRSRGEGPTRFSTAAGLVKRIVVGRPVSSYEELHRRLPKRVALPVFASDALSSSAYATDEILLTLMVAGAAVLRLSIPIAITVAAVLLVVVASYRQTVQAYPQGGGAYTVASENLGEAPGLIAAAALLTDYVLTVSVSVAAGVIAILAAFPELAAYRLRATILVVVFLMLANLRGLKESGTFFAFPTYGFLITMGGTILIGIWRVANGDITPSPAPPIEAETTLGLFLVLTAFARGSTALTGLEAITNGVPAFRPPEGRNAAATQLMLGILLTGLFLGLTFLANVVNANPLLIETESQTIPSQVAAAVFGGRSASFFVVQAFTALILLLAANTAYADFPRLASILAIDRYLPRVFQNRGDKLAFSNGIVLLSLLASLALISRNASLHDIIPIYVIGVFTSFTLSQSGMVVRWFRLKTAGWRRSAAINAVGAATTFLVFWIQVITKFRLGAWQVMIFIPALAWLLYGIRRHYTRVAEGLRMDRTVPRIEAHKVVALVSPFLGATLKALSFARALSPNEFHHVAFRIPERQLRRIRQRWKELGIKTPIQATGHRLGDLREFVRGLEPSESEPVTLVIPDPQSRNRLVQVVKGLLLLRIKRVFLTEPGVVVISVPFRPDLEPVPDRLRAPSRFSALVLVAGVHRATARAVEYARSLRPSALKGLSIAIDPTGAMDLIEEWQEWGLQCEIEIVDSPYRSITQPLLREIRELRPNPNDAVAVVIPELLVPRWWQHLLHGQTALLIKTALLFEPNVFVIDVPHAIGGARRPSGADEESSEPTDPDLLRVDGESD